MEGQGLCDEGQGVSDENHFLVDENHFFFDENHFLMMKTSFLVMKTKIYWLKPLWTTFQFFIKNQDFSSMHATLPANSNQRIWGGGEDAAET